MTLYDFFTALDDDTNITVIFDSNKGSEEVLSGVTVKQVKWNSDYIFFLKSYISMRVGVIKVVGKDDMIIRLNNGFRDV